MQPARFWSQRHVETASIVPMGTKVHVDAGFRMQSLLVLGACYSPNWLREAAMQVLPPISASSVSWWQQPVTWVSLARAKKVACIKC